MERVAVIGSGGAGKSTFARRLAVATGLPLYHLDRLYWRAGWDPTPEEEWRPLVRSLAGSRRWITDGNYSGTLSMRIDAADTVIWLDYPRLLCTRRALWRGVSQLGRTRAHDMAPGCVERVDRGFLSWVWNYQGRQRPELKRLLRDVAREKQVVVLRNDAEAGRYLRRLYWRKSGGEREGGPGIRLALPGDAEACARIHMRGWRAAYGHIFPEEVFAERERNRPAEWAEHLSLAPGNGRVWVSELDGRVVGFAYTRPGNDSDIGNGGELKLFYVEPGLRGAGIGLGLFEKAVDDLRERGYRPYLYTLEENRAAQGWYAKRGWRHDGRSQPWSDEGQYPEIRELRYRPSK